MNDPASRQRARRSRRGADRTISRRAINRAAVAAGATLTGASMGSWAMARDLAGAQTPLATPTAGVGTRLPGAPTVARQATVLGSDVTTIFRFVADEVRYEAYEGGLRGPEGTLWGMAGNSVDKAQLLAALLQQANIKPRFAFGALSEADTARLAQSMQPGPDSTRAQDAQILVPAASPAATPAGLTPDQQALLASLPAQRQKLIDAARTELASTAKTIDDGLASVSITPPAPPSGLPGLERTRHVWVQYLNGGTWVDLDPSFAGQAPAKALTTATTTSANLPSDVFHQMAIRLTVEIVTGGQPVRSDALSFQTRCQDLVAVPLTLVQAPPEITGQAAAVATGAQPYIPTLVVGSAGITGKPFALATEGGLGALGGLGGPTEGDTLAEWLNVDIIAPGGQKTTVTREIFDRVGAVARASGQVDISSVPPATLTPIGSTGQFYLPLMGITSIAVAGGKTPWTYFQQDYRIADRLADLTNVSHGHHYVRDVLMAELEGETGYRFYPDAPNVTAVTLIPTAVATNSATMAATIDIISRSAAAVPVSAKPALHPFVAAGVLAHLAERTLAEGGAGQLPDAPPMTSVGVGRVFAEAANEGVPIRALAPNSAVPADLQVSDLARIEIDAALQAGYAVIVPAREVTLNGAQVIGWWRIDPRTGAAVDQMEGGKGESTDYLVLLGEVLKTILEAEHFAWCLSGLVAVAGLVIGIISGNATAIGIGSIGVVKSGLTCTIIYLTP